jgi:hypothetical protein
MPTVKKSKKQKRSLQSDADVHIVELDNGRILNQSNKLTEFGPLDDTGASNKDLEHSANIIAQDDELSVSLLMSFSVSLPTRSSLMWAYPMIWRLPTKT